MRAAIGWTYNLLTDFQRRLLRRFSVAATFDIDDAEALGDGELAEVLDGLSALVDFHLVTPARADGPARFELAPSIRDFAAEELASAGRRDGDRDALDRLARGPGQKGGERNHCAGARCLVDLARGRARLPAQRAAAVPGLWARPRSARAGGGASALLGRPRGTPGPQRLLDRAIDLATESDIQSAALAEALLWSGLMGIRVLVADRADLYVERLDRGEEWARQFGDDRLLMLAAECRLLTTLMTGNFERGAQATTEGLEIARRSGELCWISRFEMHSARWYQAAADDRAVTSGLAALENAQRAADTRATLNAALMLQTLAPMSRAAAAALPSPQEMLTMARQTHQKASESVLLPILAVQSSAAGDIPAAARWCADALDISGFDPASYLAATRCSPRSRSPAATVTTNSRRGSTAASGTSRRAWKPLCQPAS